MRDIGKRGFGAAGAVFALAILGAACGGVRETVPLQFPSGDGRDTTDELAAAISRHGYAPLCEPRAFCRFPYGGEGTIHFKLKATGAVLALDVKRADELAPADFNKLLDTMSQLGQQIWNEAVSAAMARRQATEATQKEQARIDAQRRAEEAARLEAERKAEEAARFEAERQAALQVFDAIGYEPSQRGAAFKVVAPEGAVCRIEGDSAWTAPKQLEIPFQIPAARDLYYTFDCQLDQGVLWHKKLQAKDGLVTVVRLQRGSPPAMPAPGLPPGPPGHHHPPPPPPGQVFVPVPGPVQVVVVPGHAAPVAMDAASFASLVASVQKESFSDGKLKVIQLAATAGYFSSAQVGALVDLLTFSADKVRAVELTRGHIVDRQNAHTILSHFTFSSDKDAVTKLLAQ